MTEKLRLLNQRNKTVTPTYRMTAYDQISPNLLPLLSTRYV